MPPLLITTKKGLERKACIEYLDVLRAIGGKGECILTPFQGVVLLESSLPLDAAYSEALRRVVSFARRVIPLYDDESFLRRWLHCRGYIRPKCNERGVNGVCRRLISVLFKLNPNVRPLPSSREIDLHIEVIGLRKGMAVLPEGCDSLDKVYMDGFLRGRCLRFVRVWSTFPSEFFESNTFIIKY